MVEFDPDAALPRGLKHPLFTLPERLAAVTGRQVHLTERQAFANPYFRQSVDAGKELIYDADGEEAALGRPQ